MAPQSAERPSAHLVYVWDLPTRLFHWLLVASVFVALFTGFIAPEWWMGVHLAAGYMIVLLLVFRLVWGVFGPEYSRLTSLVRASRWLKEYLWDLLILRPQHHIGHNPAGAVMIFALFSVLTALVATGLMVQGGEEKQGPFAGIVGYAAGNGAKVVHEALVYVLLTMVSGHVIGVLAEGWLQKAPLIRAMITGWIPLPPDVPAPSPRHARPRPAAISLAAFAGVAAITLGLLSRVPPLGIPTMPVNQALQEECGACHWAYHPSLLPRASWAALMANLDDHFGEDATLPAAQVAEIAAFLDAYAAEAWDTEAARRFANLAPNEPLRITATPYWVTKHDEVDAAAFAAPAVKSKGNCIACHRDADGGRFDDQAIHIPPSPATGASP